MTPELVALATSAATTVVSAMATDAWQAVRTRIGKLLGRGDQRAEQAVLETLDEDAASLSDSADTAEVRRELSAGWTARLRDLLRADPNAADALRELIAEVAGPGGGVSASGHGVAAGRDVHIEATQGGIAAGVIHGSVTAHYPSTPGTDQA